MSDRTIAGLLMIATTVFCWWLSLGYVRAGEIASRYGVVITRQDHPHRFWTAVIFTALVGLLPFTLALLAFSR